MCSRPTICADCAHAQVCAYKKDYIAMVERLGEVFEAFQPANNDKSFMSLKDPDCKYHRNTKIQAPIFMAGNNMRGDEKISVKMQVSEDVQETIRKMRETNP